MFLLKVLLSIQVTGCLLYIIGVLSVTLKDDAYIFGVPENWWVGEALD